MSISKLLACAATLLAICALPASARTILFIGNSFTYGANSPAHYYRAETVTDLNGPGPTGKTVDLVMEGAIKNELFRREVERTREVVYAARAKRTVPELRAPTLERVSSRARADLKVRR